MRTLTVITTIVAFAAATPCAAQRATSLALGADVGIRAPATSGLQLRSGASFTQLRLGIALTPTLSVEPTLLVAEVSSPNADLALGAALLYRLSATGVSPYFRPFADLRRGGRNVALAYDAGLGLGVSAPIADRVDLRVEGTAVHWLGASRPGSFREGRLMVGLTYYRGEQASH
jgi:hypothetical protein